MGQDPPAFDILAWNGDSTRMPAAMHSFYLRSLYMRNELAAGELELAGQRLSLSSVTSDTYAVGAINDHIVPWHGSYKTGGLLGGEVRYVLSSGGHIAGIVNPPGPPRTPGAPRPASTRAHGGKTGPRGLTPGPERTSSRRPWAANGTPPSATPPASTYAAETWTGGSPLQRDLAPRPGPSALRTHPPLRPASAGKMNLHSHHRSVRPCRFRTADLA
jgi:polyhydroxyalkanoate synthase